MILAPTRKQYVNGFMLNHVTEQVLFIEKQHPAFQRGKWNGVGGHIEAGETTDEAMCREFYEETGAITTAEDWEHTLTLQGHDYVVFFYRSVVDVFPVVRQTTDEALGFFYRNSMNDPTNPLPVLDNLKWILPLQFARDIRFPVTVECH